jgi:hypothetical protein
LLRRYLCGPELQIQPEDCRDASERLERRVALSRHLEPLVGLLADPESVRSLLLSQTTTLARRQDGERDPHIQFRSDAMEGAASMSATRRDVVAVLDGDE